MVEQITMRQCPKCGGTNYSKLEDCLLCSSPLEAKEADVSELPTIREGHSHLVMFLEVLSGPVKEEKYLLKNGLIVGRSNKADIQIMSEEASRKHAEIKLDHSERWLLTDLGSTNGTVHNGKEIDAKVLLMPGDEIEIGDAIFRVLGG